MEKIYKYWKIQSSGKEGYSKASITFHAESSYDKDGRVEESCGKDRKTLNAAISDAKRFYKKNPDALISIYANAELMHLYEDGTTAFKSETDCVRLGSIHFGEYFDLCEQRDWL